MTWWQILLIILAIITLLLLFLHSTKICEGGRIMQGCGKLLFPWTKKYKIPGFDNYCCEACFKRDFELVAMEGTESKMGLKFTEREEENGIERDTDDEG